MTDQLSQVFAALADPTRRDMVTRLCAGDATVGELAAPYDVSMQAVSKHLKVLETAGLVTREREAQRRPVHLEAEVFDLMTKWIERYRREAEERYQRLDAVLAAMNEAENDDTTQHQPRKEPHHEHHPEDRRRHHHHRGRPEPAADQDDPRLPRHTGAAGPGAHRPRAVRAVDRPERPGHQAATTGTPARVAAGATCPPATTRSTPSTAASTRCATTGSCRPSPTRASPTASPWRP